MQKLKQTFRKNGIDYKLIKRSDAVALFELRLYDNIVGYEVNKIYQNEERTMAGVLIPAGEGITGNEQFGSDGSKAFFPDDRVEADRYYHELVFTKTFTI